MNLDRLSWFVGEVSRPLSILIATIGATSVGVIASLKVSDGNDGSILMLAVGGYASSLFLAKAVEIWKGSKDSANVEIAKANTATAAPQPVVVINDDRDPIPVSENPSQR